MRKQMREQSYSTRPRETPRFARFLSAALVALVTLMGCAGAKVQVPPADLPIPLVKQLPVSVGLYLSDELISYFHEEEMAQNGTWRIDIGNAQELMFDNLAAGLFARHSRVAALPGSDTGAELTGGIDAVLAPSIEQLQFAIPAQTRSDYFEVWIRYRFQLLDPKGEKIAEFPLEAYGRANSRNYGFMEDTANGALQEAARQALRDTMTFFSIRFPQYPAVKRWLRSQQTQTEPGALLYPERSARIAALSQR